MKLSVEIKSTKLQTFSGIAKRTGLPYEITKQTGWIDLGKDYPQEIELNIEKGNDAYPVGFYILSPDSFYVDRNKNVCIRPVLQAPVAPVLDKKAG